MTAKDDLAAKLIQLEAQMAASDKRAAELEAKLSGIVEATKPASAPERLKSDKSDYAPIDYTRGASLPPSVVREMVAAVDDRLMADLRADARKPNPVTAGTSQLTPPGSGQGEVQRGSGWRDTVKLGPPPGINYVDQQCDTQDAIDAAERLRQTIWGKRR
jgi:hypothetical protein